MFKLSALFCGLLVLILSLGLHGCASVVSEQVLMPPGLLNRAIGSIKVEPFKNNYGNLFAEQIKGRLQAEGYIKVFNNDAEAVLGGILTISQIERTTYHKSYEVTKKNSQGHQYTTNVTTYFVKKAASASVTYTLTQGDKTLAGNTHTSIFNNETSGDSTSEAESKLQNDEVIVSNLLSQLVDKIIPDISPHYEQWKFELQTSGNDFLGAGAEYYKNGLYSQAEEYWKRVITEVTEPKLGAAANYNLGVLKIRQSQYDQAFNMFREADRLDPANRVYMEALAQVEKAGVGSVKLRSMGIGADPSQIDPDRGESGGGRKFHLTVNVVPVGSRIRIMNITPRYQPGIKLIPGDYKIFVNKEGYHSYSETVRITNSDLNLDVILRKK